MPELPEVEIVKRGLEQLMGSGMETLSRVDVSPHKLRFQPSPDSLERIKGQRVRGFSRRAKYILFELERDYLLSHLGMTGSWRLEQEPKKHDHLRLHFQSGKVLTYCDPRRFGGLEVVPKAGLEDSQRLKHFGPDPLNTELFSVEYLLKTVRHRTVPIKTLIMNQEIVVGVGNIYAGEALYISGISPLMPARELSKLQAERLVESIQEVLKDAIACGGTSFRDFRQTGGNPGYFQNFLLVYGRDREPCVFCDTPIHSQVIGGRNSFWCPSCQKLL